MEKNFFLTADMVDKIRKFHPECKSIYTGACGGGEFYTFMPTGFGDVVKYTCKCGAVVDVTDYDNF